MDRQTEVGGDEGAQFATRGEASCAAYLDANGPTKTAVVGVARAGHMMYADHYGWFERPAGTPRGVYGVTPKGRAALGEYAEVVAGL